MKKIILIVQIIISLILIVMILLQTSPEKSNTSLSLVQPKFTKRGIEKLTFSITILLLFVFLLLSFFQLRI